MNCRLRRILASALLVIGIGVGGTARARAQLPAARLTAVFPPGGAQGSSLEVSVSGSDLDEATELLFSHEGIVAKPRIGDPDPILGEPQPVPGRFDVRIGQDVPVGIYDVRVVGRFGVSNPRAFAVGHLPAIGETEGNNKASEAQRVPMEVTVHGQIGGGTDVDSFRFRARGGQRVLVDCQAYEIDSRLDAVLVLLDGEGREIVRRQNVDRRDPFLDFTPESDGEYVIQLYDAVYGGSAEYVYRVSIGTFPRLDFVFPPVGSPGTRGRYVLYGRNLPGGQPAPDEVIDGRPLEKLEVDLQLPWPSPDRDLPLGGLMQSEQAFLDGFFYRFRYPLGTTNPYFISLASAPVVLEETVVPKEEGGSQKEGPTKDQVVVVPCEVAGRFYPRGDEDSFRFTARKGERLHLELLSQRLGLPTDPQFVLQRVRQQNEGETFQDLKTVDDIKGGVGGENFSTTTDDPADLFTVPEDGVYRIVVRDLFGSSHADPRHVYRLVIRREAPDFRLVAAPIYPMRDTKELNVWSVLVRPGGTEKIEVLALRQDGFGGPIDVDVEWLPEGVTATTLRLGPGRQNGTIVLSASESAPTWKGLIGVVGRSTIGGLEVSRRARAGALVWPGQQNVSRSRARLVSDLALAVTGRSTDALPFAVELGASASVKTAHGGKIQVPVKVTRRGDFKGEVQLIPQDLPPNVEAKPVKVAGDKTEATVEFNIKKGAPVGAFTVHFRADSEVSYRRNPEAAERAATRKSVVDEKVVALETEAKEVADEKTAREAEASARSQELAGAKAAVDAAQKAVADAKSALAEARKGLEGAQTKQTELAAAQGAAEEAKASLEKKVKEVTEQLAKLKGLQEQAKKQSEEANKQAAPRKAKVTMPTAALELEVTSAPFALSVEGKRARAVRGGALEVPVRLERFSGWADPVEVSLVVPEGMAGVACEPIKLEGGASEGKLALQIGADATVGQHVLEVKASGKFAGEDRALSEPFVLMVEEEAKP